MLCIIFNVNKCIHYYKITTFKLLYLLLILNSTQLRSASEASHHKGSSDLHNRLRLAWAQALSFLSQWTTVLMITIIQF